VTLSVLVLEPYYGGSHRAVLRALLPSLDVSYDLLTLPARKWKWRMRGAAITMAAETRRLHAEGNRWDLVYASTFLNLAEFLGLAGDAVRGVPAAVYFHENQLLYPNRHTAEWDLQFPLTNVTSALAADACLFNTRWNLDGFVSEIPGFLRQFPDHVPSGVAEAIEGKSSILAPPFDPSDFDGVEPVRGRRPRVVWPHRWEHDKAPEAFFAAVTALAREGLDFEVAVAGQSFRETADTMAEAASVLGDRLVYLGEPEGRGAYAALLASADIAVSTATNEFFGLSMVEACYTGATPVVPDRLAYRELYPAAFRYGTHDALVATLRALVLERPAPGAARHLAEAFTVDRLAPDYQAAFERIVTLRRA
jgi:glycosyltransferase involved in cell wall biosynthesis